MARDNRPKIIDVERSLGIWFEAGLHRHKGGYKIAEVKELRLEIDRLTAYYGFYSIDEIRKSEELRDAITVLFNNVGPRFWPDPPVDRHRWLADATHNNLSGRYPHDLFFSDPQDCARHVPSDIHDKLPLMSSRLHDLFTDLVVLKCIKFFENHGRHPTHQESAFNFEVDPEYVEAGGYPSRCEQKSRASETKRTAAPAPVAQMLPSPATTCSTGSQTVCEDRTPLTFKPSSNARESSGGRERTEEHPQKRKMPTQDSGTKKARQEPMMKALGSPSTGSSQFSVGHRLPPAHSMQGRSSPQTPVPDVSQSQQPTSSKFLDGHPSKARGHGDPEPQATTNQHPAQTCNSDAGQMTQGLTATPRTSWTSINGQDIDQGSALDMAPSALAPNDELAEASENSARQENFDANTPQGMIVGTVLTQQELTPTNDDSGEGVQPLRTTQTIPDNFVDLTEDSDDEPVMPSIQAAPVVTSSGNAPEIKSEPAAAVKLEDEDDRASAACDNKHNTASDADGSRAILERTDVGVYWSSDTVFPHFVELENCDTVEDFFKNISDARPKEYSARRIVTVNVRLLNPSNFDGNPNCSLQYGEGKGTAAFRQLIRMLKKQDRGVCPRLEVTFVYE